MHMDTGSQGSRSTWLEIDLKALQANAAELRKEADCDLLAVVKANGYGHGAIPVARAAMDAGCTYLGVAQLAEAVELRRGGISSRILVTGPLAPAEVVDAIGLDLDQTCWRLDQLTEADQVARQKGIRARVHLKLDVGMTRFGAEPDEIPELARHAASLPGIDLVGLSTHLPSSDEPNEEITQRQLEIFEEVIDSLRSASLCPEIIHAANSAAAARFPGARFDMIRAGLALYGVVPGPETPISSRLSPVMTWKTRILEIKSIPGGRTIGYGGEFVSPSKMRIGVIGVGYVDGFRRTPKASNYVLTAEGIARVVGRVCMQHCMIDLTHHEGAKRNDECVLLGTTGGETIRPQDLAERWRTNEWDVFCGIDYQVPRIFTP